MTFPSNLLYEHFAHKLVEAGMPRQGRLQPLLALASVEDGKIRTIQAVPNEVSIWCSPNVREQLDVVTPQLLAHPVPAGVEVGVVMIYEAQMQILESFPTQRDLADMSQSGFEANRDNGRLTHAVFIEVRHNGGVDMGWLPITSSGSITYRPIETAPIIPLDAQVDMSEPPARTLH